jgi:Chalcone isomerase like
MKTSPLQPLLSRHVCCYHSILPQSRLLQRPCTRFLSTSAPRRGPFSSSYGSSELLKRRYQNSPSSVQLSAAERAKAVRRMKISLAGIIICAACMFGVVSQYSSQLPEPSKQEREPSSNVVKFDAPPSIAGVSLDTSVGDDVEQIPTGTSTIPTFPKIIHLSSMSDSPASDEQEYQLIGLGIRTVSFLSIQVYVVGLYIAVPDIATLQERLMRVLDPIATTLVPGERSKLKEILLDPEKGEEVWNAILKDGNLRTAIRIVPTRNTDLQHLRDGFVRGITARTRHLDSIKAESFSDDAFGAAVAQFKAIWGGGARKNVPKGETLLMTRDAKGRMAAWVEDKKGDSVRLGAVDDERVSRLIWLGYLGGKTVSSEGARQSVVDGVVEFVERPVGTVATQVV